jgi:hypothetical protein
MKLRPPAADGHDYCDVVFPRHGTISEYKEAAISYIVGYVVRMVEKKIHCPQRLAALTTSKESIPDFIIVLVQLPNF